MLIFFTNIITSFYKTITAGINIYNTFFGHIKDVSFFDVLIISDGMSNTYKYLSELFIIKFTKDEALTSDNKKYILSRYKKLYTLAYFDRYLLYILIYLFFSCVQIATNNNYIINRFMYMSCYLISFPFVQNRILDLHYIDKTVVAFIEKKNTFLLYSLSKTIIRFIQGLSPNIIDIQHLHIFILYNYLSIAFITEFLKTFAIVSFLNTIRQHESTYYYYKAIKLSYYYNTGYLFNVISKNDAVCLINSMIKQKQWKNFCKKEVVNAIYSLCTNRDFFSDDTFVQINIIIIRIFSLWSILSLLKIFSTLFTTYLFILYITCICLFNSKSKKKHVALSILIYTLLLLNVNELLIAIFFIKYNILYDSFVDFIFFLTNYHQLRKVLNYYQPLRDINDT